MPSTYQMPRNGAASSGQCSEYTRAPRDPAAKPPAAPASRRRVGASPRIAQKIPTNNGVDINAMRNGQTPAVYPKIKTERSRGSAVSNATAASSNIAPAGASPRSRQPGDREQASVAERGAKGFLAPEHLHRHVAQQRRPDSEPRGH